MSKLFETFEKVSNGVTKIAVPENDTLHSATKYQPAVREKFFQEIERIQTDAAIISDVLMGEWSERPLSSNCFHSVSRAP